MRLVLLGAVALVGFELGVDGQGPVRSQSHRSPIAVAVFGAGTRALVANHTADSVSLVDLGGGRMLAEVPCGRKPAAVACSADGRHAVVSNLWSGTLTLFEVEKDTLRVAGHVEVGAFPRGVVFADDGSRVYVAAGDAVVEVDWTTRQVRARWAAPRETRGLALSRDGRWLAAASSRSGQVRCWDLHAGKLHWERTIDDGFNLRGLAFAADGGSILCSHVVRRDFPVSRDNIEQGWVTDSRITRLALAADVVPSAWQIALDVRGRAVGDPEALAVVGDHLVLAAGGTHELLLLENGAIQWNAGDPGDFLDARLQERDRFRRVPLGGRPIAVVPCGNGRVVVANYLLDCLQIVDVAKGAMIRTIALGAPTAHSLAREGEAIFYDAGRSHNQWFSCHTCHVDGHTCGLNFDTLNDESYGTPKLTPSLRNVTKTGPWTWQGRHKDLGAAVTFSLTTTMFGPAPTARERDALVAFMGTLAPPPNPHLGQGGSLPPAARRGQDLFHGKAACTRCHRPPYYTTAGLYDVKLDGERLWNPPSLIGLHDRGPYLHDGRARSLDSLLQDHHTPESLGGERLTAAECADLIAFLRTR